MVRAVPQIVESDDKDSPDSDSVDEYREYHDGANCTPPVSCADATTVVPTATTLPVAEPNTDVVVADVVADVAAAAAAGEQDEVAMDNGYESSS